MKAFLALFLFVAVSSAAELYELRLLGNHLEDLAVATLEYARFLMKRHSPYVLPPMPDQHLQDTDIDFILSANNMGVSKADDFVIKLLTVNPLTLEAKFQVVVPAAHVEGNYKISGTGWNKKVEGSGSIAVDVTNLSVTGSLQCGVVDHSIQLKSLVVDNDMEGMKLTIDGLNIEGYTKEQINDFINTKLWDYLKANKDNYDKHIAAKTIEVVNKLLLGHTLADVIAWDTKLVASTPDPPPFTFPSN